jgi:acetolactate synthase-1/2/3 large subunit
MAEQRGRPAERAGIGTRPEGPAVDFAALARSFGGHGERVERTDDFAPAFERALRSGQPAILHCLVDPQALTPAITLDAIRERALQSAAS